MTHVILFLFISVLLVLSTESFKSFNNVRKISRRISVAGAVVPVATTLNDDIPNLLKGDENIVTSESDVLSETTVPIAPAASKGFGKRVAVEVSEEGNNEKGKRSEAKKKYQQDRKIGKTASTLGNMMGSAQDIRGGKFNNQNYV